MHLATWVDRPLMRLSRGRLRLSFVIPVLLLRCQGAHTGILREVPLLYVPVGDDVLVVASNGGQTRAPAWCYNLRGRPEVECLMKGETSRFLAEELTGQSRDDAWRRVTAVYPGYLEYAQRAQRLIPLFLLRRLSSTVESVESERNIQEGMSNDVKGYRRRIRAQRNHVPQACIGSPRVR